MTQLKKALTHPVSAARGGYLTITLPQIETNMTDYIDPDVAQMHQKGRILVFDSKTSCVESVSAVHLRFLPSPLHHFIPPPPTSLPTLIAPPPPQTIKALIKKK